MSISPAPNSPPPSADALFSLLSGEKLRVLEQAARQHRYDRGSTILRHADRAAGVHVLLSGRAKAVTEDGQGRVMTLSFIEPGELFGSASDALDEADNWTAIEALSACETLCIPRGVFIECIEGNYAAAMLILRGVEARLRRAYLNMASLGLLGVYERVAKLFTESARQVNGQWIVETGSEEIARTIAASREMVSRVVKDMKRRGLVRKDKRRTVILDWPSMTAAWAP